LRKWKNLKRSLDVRDEKGKRGKEYSPFGRENKGCRESLKGTTKFAVNFRKIIKCPIVGGHTAWKTVVSQQ